MRATKLFWICVLAAVALGQESSVKQAFTEGFPNGRFWQGISNTEKLMFVTGYRLGLLNGCTSSKSPGGPSGDCMLSDKSLSLRPDEVCTQISLFYADPASLPIPLPMVMAPAYARLSGMSDENVKL